MRREEILRATIKEIETSGMVTLRVGDVASSLGVSPALVFYHFETRDALLVEALEFAVERDLQRLATNVLRGRTPTQRLSQVISSYGPTGAAHGWTLWIDAWTMALREPTIRRALRRLDDRWRKALETAVGEGVASGDFTCPDPAAAAARIGALLDGLSVAVLVYRSVTRSQLRTWVREAIATEIGIDATDLA